MHHLQVLSPWKVGMETLYVLKEFEVQNKIDYLRVGEADWIWVDGEMGGA